ncbi:conserved protein of unknown function (plasmid) [Paraburkholderia kururiensis]|uniref:hypothetical protein n=1 Tax=Paraburkholderia kururiensis TaxID=984307 RepID=UPI0039A6ECA4
MFHTVGYKGHYIHLACRDGVETIQTQIIYPDGAFALHRCNTYAGAQRAITRHVRSAPAGAND